jgi:ribosomal protein S12 methylthiotransferase accessory factor
MLLHPSPRIGLLGDGLLAQALRQKLESSYAVCILESRDLSSEERVPCSLLILCDDSSDPLRQHEVNQQCLRHGLPWLRVCLDGGQGIIGPWVLPGEPGCVLCVQRRVQAARKEADEAALLQDLPGQPRASRSPAPGWLTAWHLDWMALFVAQDVATGLLRPHQALTFRAVLLLDLVRLHWQRHPFLPDPACPACGAIPPDTAEAATIRLEHQPKPEPRTYRVRSLTAHALFTTYVDAYAGLIHTLSRLPHRSIASVACEAGITCGPRTVQLLGLGRALNYAQSELSAIAEALERYGGQCPKGKRTMIRASYAQLVEQGLEVLNPTTLGLHTPEQYALPDFAYVPYHPDLIFPWVWGYSFGRQRPVLVPEQVAYYGVRHGTPADNGPCFVYEISNGCALGTCLEEALFYGILEVAERDGFLFTWYTRCTPPQLDPRSARDPLVRLVIAHLEEVTGCRIALFDTTYDHAVACCWVMTVDEENREERPKALCAAGAHPDPEQAVLGALQELDAMLKAPPGWFRHQRERAKAMVDDPFAVKEMQDHSCLYFLPETFERLAFLQRSSRLHAFQEIYGNLPCHLTHADLRDDLTELLNHYLERGTDVIVVDQTSAEHTAQGLRCVKVLMPGMLPMTFGHQHRRISGLPRLFSLPQTLGYRREPLSASEINPYPHPFP